MWVQNETQLGVPLASAQATAPQAAAVATAESSRVPDNTNVNSPASLGIDYGLFQINPTQNPAFAGQVNPDNVDQSAIFIPNVNVADAAIALRNGGTNWGPWSSSQHTKDGDRMGGRSRQSLRMKSRKPDTRAEPSRRPLRDLEAVV